MPAAPATMRGGHATMTQVLENGSATAAIRHHQAVGSSIGLSRPKQRGLARGSNRL